MKNFLLAFLVFLIWACVGMWYYTCSIRGLCASDNVQTENSVSNEQKVIDTAEAKKRRRSDSISNAEKIDLELKQKELNQVETLFSSRDFKVVNMATLDTVAYYPNPLTIYKNRARVYVPQPNREMYTVLTNALRNDTAAELLVYGPYDPDTEIIKTDSLGIQRAETFKNQLVRYGASESQIKTLAIQRSLDFDSQNRSFYGLVLILKGKSSVKKDIVQTRPIRSVEENRNKRIFHSLFINDSFKATKELNDYSNHLLGLLKKIPSIKINVTGFTDNIGNDEDNRWIGLENAKKVRRYFVNKGIPADKIIAKSLGEANPIFPNTSDYNRSRNKRIEILLN